MITMDFDEYSAGVLYDILKRALIMSEALSEEMECGEMQGYFQDEVHLINFLLDGIEKAAYIDQHVSQ